MCFPSPLSEYGGICYKSKIRYLADFYRPTFYRSLRGRYFNSVREGPRDANWLSTFCNCETRLIQRQRVDHL